MPGVPSDQGRKADDETDAPHAQDHQLGPQHNQLIKSARFILYFCKKKINFRAGIRMSGLNFNLIFYFIF
jgi:hypothetical protein